MSTWLLMKTDWTITDANKSVLVYQESGFLAHWTKDKLSGGFNIYVKESLFKSTMPKFNSIPV
jgi:hypothetical protein